MRIITDARPDRILDFTEYDQDLGHTLSLPEVEQRQMLGFTLCARLLLPSFDRDVRHWSAREFSVLGGTVAPAKRPYKGVPPAGLEIALTPANLPASGDIPAEPFYLTWDGLLYSRRNLLRRALQSIVPAAVAEDGYIYDRPTDWDAAFAPDLGASEPEPVQGI